jgi:hypothetical protein
MADRMNDVAAIKRQCPKRNSCSTKSDPIPGAEVRAYLRKQRRKLRPEVEVLLDGILHIIESGPAPRRQKSGLTQLLKTVVRIRCRAYESLNQVLHHYAVVCAAERMWRENPGLRSHDWSFNFRQGGGKNPDIEVSGAGEKLAAAEVTTSLTPQAAIRRRQGGVCDKLRKSKAKDMYYFVITPKMEPRAKQSARKKDITVRVLDIGWEPIVDCDRCD